MIIQILEGVLAALIVFDIALRLFMPTPFWTRYELRNVIREVLVEYGVAKDPGRALLDHIATARLRAGQAPLSQDSPE